jgi:uncharacterized protein (DUF924 family)
MKPACHTLLHLPAGFGRRIHSVWFGAFDMDRATLPEVGKYFFSKNEILDARIASEFGEFLELAVHQVHSAKSPADLVQRDLLPEDQLGLILLLDQFTRNIYRGSPKFVQGDPLALLYARNMVNERLDRAFSVLERVFIYLPFEHSENIDDQHRSLELFQGLADDFPHSGIAAGCLKYAQSHCADIEEFGRFPHRNDILGRTSTPAELERLKRGSG